MTKKEQHTLLDLPNSPFDNGRMSISKPAKYTDYRCPMCKLNSQIICKIYTLSNVNFRIFVDFYCLLNKV